MFSLTPVVKNLLIINVGIFLGATLLSMQPDIVRIFALYPIESNNFRAWQLVTHMFLHGSFRHLIGNMLGLIIFGAMLEEIWGSKRFLQFYFICGLGAAVLYLGAQFVEDYSMRQDVRTFVEAPSPLGYRALIYEHFMHVIRNPEAFIEQYSSEPDNSSIQQRARQNAKELYQYLISYPTVGASGAVYGILLAVALLFPTRKVILLIPPIPVRIRILAILLGVYTVYSILQNSPTDNVAHLAHLGGMVVGYVVLVIWGEAQNRYQ